MAHIDFVMRTATGVADEYTLINDDENQQGTSILRIESEKNIANY